MNKNILNIILTAIIVMAGTYLYLAPKPEKSPTPTNDSAVAIGKPCSPSQINLTTDTKGLQCYFYDDEAQTSPRPGIWIKPDLRHQGDWLSHKNYTSGWKIYQSPDKKISFSYPSAWSINELNWPDGVISILMGKSADIPSIINIEKVEKNAVAVADRINDAKKQDGSVLEDNITLNGSEATRLYSSGKTNIEPGSINLFVDKDNYYVAANALVFDDPLYDFPTEYLLSTLTVR